MKGALTITVEESPKIIEIIQKLDQHLKGLRIQVHSREDKENGQWVYTIDCGNFSKNQGISQMMNEISIAVGLQARGPFSSKEIPQGLKFEKITSQEIWTFSKQNSIPSKQLISDSNHGIIDVSQKSQDVSDQSGKFQVLGEQILENQATKILIGTEIKNTSNEQKHSEKFQEIKGTDVIENQEYAKKNQREHDTKEDFSLEEHIELQFQFLHKKGEQKENTEVQIAEKKCQKIELIIEKVLHLKNDEEELNEETTEILFNYFTGKDDYTEVFKVKRGDNQGQVQIQQHRINEIQVQISPLENEGIKTQIEEDIDSYIVVETEDEELEDQSVHGANQASQNKPTFPQLVEKANEIYEVNYDFIAQELNPAPLKSFFNDDTTTKAQVESIESLVEENGNLVSNDRTTNQEPEEQEKTPSEIKNPKNPLSNLLKYAIFIAVILAFLANLCM